MWHFLLLSENVTLRVGSASLQDIHCNGNEGDVVEETARQLAQQPLKDIWKQKGVKWRQVVESEMERLEFLKDGSAVAEHLEDLYFEALQRIVLKQLGAEVPASSSQKDDERKEEAVGETGEEGKPAIGMA